MHLIWNCSKPQHQGKKKKTHSERSRFPDVLKPQNMKWKWFACLNTWKWEDVYFYFLSRRSPCVGALFAQIRGFIYYIYRKGGKSKSFIFLLLPPVSLFPSQTLWIMQRLWTLVCLGRRLCEQHFCGTQSTRLRGRTPAPLSLTVCRVCPWITVAVDTQRKALRNLPAPTSTSTSTHSPWHFNGGSPVQFDDSPDEI